MPEPQDLDALAAKHGGAVEGSDDLDALAAKHGGVPVVASGSFEEPPGTLTGQAKQFGKNLGLGAAKSLGETMATMGTLGTLTGIGAGLPPISSPSYERHGIGQKLGAAAEQTGEIMLPGGGERKLAAMLPEKAQILARPALQGLSMGAINKMHGGDFASGAKAGALAGGFGEIGRGVAPGIAEGALGIRTAQKLHGASPGEAVLDETTGIRPSSISDQAKTKLGALGSQLENVASSTTAPAGTLGRSVSIVDDAIAKAQAENSPVLPHLMEIRDQLTYERTPQGGFNYMNPKAPPQTGMDIVNARRGMSDLAGNWEREGKGAPATARSVYGNLTGELHGVSPESEALDARMTGLIPAAKRADIIEHAPGIAQRVTNRIARPTGGLALPMLGAAEGYREHGGLGAAIGGAAGLVGLEALNSPTGQMAAARLLRSGVPTRAIPAMTMELLRQEEKDQQ